MRARLTRIFSATQDIMNRLWFIVIIKRQQHLIILLTTNKYCFCLSYPLGLLLSQITGSDANCNQQLCSWLVIRFCAVLIVPSLFK